MPAIPFGVLWVAYATGLWGYCLIRGYNVKFTALINPVHLADWNTIKNSQIPAGLILPGSAPSAQNTPAPSAPNIHLQPFTPTAT